MPIGKVVPRSGEGVVPVDNSSIANVIKRAQDVFKQRVACLSTHPRFNDSSILHNPRANKK